MVDEPGSILTSSDGTTWSSKTCGSCGYLYGVTYGNSSFVGVGSGGRIITSSDNGTSWTERTSGISSEKYLYEVTYGNGTFVTVGRLGTVLTSSDGTTWTEKTSGTSNLLYGVTYSQ
jgi:photosystem II stability/assembly factor-like uncharacterized protein